MKHKQKDIDMQRYVRIMICKKEYLGQWCNLEIFQLYPIAELMHNLSVDDIAPWGKYMVKEDIAATKNFFLQKNANEIFPERSSLPRFHYWDFEFSEIFVYVILFSPCMDVKQSHNCTMFNQLQVIETNNKYWKFFKKKNSSKNEN